ncbi:MAG TPA: hypothetical protein PLP05_12340 [Sedimentisphaerales bacterium]|nr:hypothetical protein [Sedimentisphaerales bacterium]
MMKLIFLVLIYCAGFATAIYMTTPSTVKAGGVESANSTTMISPETTQKINIGMRKCVDVSKDAAVSASEYIKTKLKEKDIKG